MGIGSGWETGKETHDRSLELGHDANDIGRVGGVLPNGLDFKVGSSEGSSEDRSDEGKSE